MNQILRPLYFCLGLAFVLLGIIGALLPLMPTTIFLILAAWCFARSSKRAEAWLLGHRQFGPAIVAWRDKQAISRRNKIVACCGMAIGYTGFWLGARPSLWLALVVFGAIAACAVFVASRPDPANN